MEVAIIKVLLYLKPTVKHKIKVRKELFTKHLPFKV
jgi:hypothetical protein